MDTVNNKRTRDGARIISVPCPSYEEFKEWSARIGDPDGEIDINEFESYVWGALRYNLFIEWTIIEIIKARRWILLDIFIHLDMCVLENNYSEILDYVMDIFDADTLPAVRIFKFVRLDTVSNLGSMFLNFLYGITDEQIHTQDGCKNRVLALVSESEKHGVLHIITSMFKSYQDPIEMPRVDNIKFSMIQTFLRLGFKYCTGSVFREVFLQKRHCDLPKLFSLLESEINNSPDKVQVNNYIKKMLFNILLEWWDESLFGISQLMLEIPTSTKCAKLITEVLKDNHVEYIRTHFRHRLTSFLSNSLETVFTLFYHINIFNYIKRNSPESVEVMKYELNESLALHERSEKPSMAFRAINRAVKNDSCPAQSCRTIVAFFIDLEFIDQDAVDNYIFYRYINPFWFEYGQYIRKFFAVFRLDSTSEKKFANICRTRYLNNETVDIAISFEHCQSAYLAQLIEVDQIIKTNGDPHDADSVPGITENILSGMNYNDLSSKPELLTRWKKWHAGVFVKLRSHVDEIEKQADFQFILSMIDYDTKNRLLLSDNKPWQCGAYFNLPPNIWREIGSRIPGIDMDFYFAAKTFLTTTNTDTWIRMLCQTHR